MRHFNLNGVVIQATNTTTTAQKLGLVGAEYENYRGLDNYDSWPLKFDVDPVSELLTKELEGHWFSPPLEHPAQFYVPQFVHMVLTNREFCIKYVNQCHKRSIKARVLFCFTERPEPRWDSPTPELRFLGFDHAITNHPDSSIFWDLLGEHRAPYTEIETFKNYLKSKKKLNENSLFNTYDDIAEYVKARDQVLSNPETSNLIESDSEDCPYLVFKLYELIGQLHLDGNDKETSLVLS
jgi:hypothetical protein